MSLTILSDRRRNILLLIFSMLGILGLVGRGVYLVIQGSASSDLAFGGALDSTIFGALGMFFCAALLFPMLVYALRRLKGQEVAPAKLPPIKLWQAAVLVSIWLFSIVFASIVESLPGYGWIVAGPFFLLGIAIPVVGFLWIAAGGLPGGSWKRLWSAFGIGMAGSTVIAMLLEYLIVGIGVLAAGVFVVANPEWRAIIVQLKDQITNTGDIQSLLTTLSPYLTNPLVLLLILAFGSILAPLIEEALKPAAVWLVGKNLHSPAEGFVLGALCGAGFAVLEGVTAASGAIGVIGFGLLARAASSLMHITASGVMGWGIVSAYREKNYGHLLAAYLISVSLHGLWNGSALLAVYGALRFSLQGSGVDLFGAVAVVAGVAVLGITLLSILILLPVINHWLRSTEATRGVIIAPPQS